MCQGSRRAYVKNNGDDTQNTLIMAILELVDIGGQVIPALPLPVTHGQKPIQHGLQTGVDPNPPQGHNLGLASVTPQQMIVTVD